MKEMQVHLFPSEGRVTYMSNETENKDLALGDLITLDGEDGEEIGDFEVIALFDLKGKQYVALTAALEEEGETDDDTEEEVDIYVFSLEEGELVPLDESEEEAVYEKLDQVLEDVELIGHTHDHDHDHDHK